MSSLGLVEAWLEATCGKRIDAVVAPPDMVEAVKAILLQEIDLAKPDDLAFLEFQVPRIAERIADRLMAMRAAVGGEQS